MIRMFTDGSCKRDRSGWAFILKDGFWRRTGSGTCHYGDSNYAELKAVVEGLATLYSCTSQRHVTIYTDSKYVIRGCSRKARNAKHKQLWILLEHYKELIAVRFVKISGRNLPHHMCREILNDALESQ